MPNAPSPRRETSTQRPEVSTVPDTMSGRVLSCVNCGTTWNDCGPRCCTYCDHPESCGCGEFDCEACIEDASNVGGSEPTFNQTGPSLVGEPEQFEGSPDADWCGEPCSMRIDHDGLCR